MGPDILAPSLHNYCISRKDNIRPNAYEISFEKKKRENQNSKKQDLSVIIKLTAYLLQSKLSIVLAFLDT